MPDSSSPGATIPGTPSAAAARTATRTASREVRAASDCSFTSVPPAWSFTPGARRALAACSDTLDLEVEDVAPAEVRVVLVRQAQHTIAATARVRTDQG